MPIPFLSTGKSPSRIGEGEVSKDLFLPHHCLKKKSPTCHTGTLSRSATLAYLAQDMAKNEKGKLVTGKWRGWNSRESNTCHPSTSTLVSSWSGLAGGWRMLAVSPGCPSASPSPDPPGSPSPNKQTQPDWRELGLYESGRKSAPPFLPHILST